MALQQTASPGSADAPAVQRDEPDADQFETAAESSTGRLPGTDFQFTIRRANKNGATPLVARERFAEAVTVGVRSRGDHDHEQGEG